MPSPNLLKMLDECSQALKQELVDAIRYDDYYYARRYISALEGIKKATYSIAQGIDGSVQAVKATRKTAKRA